MSALIIAIAVLFVISILLFQKINFSVSLSKSSTVAIDYLFISLNFKTKSKKSKSSKRALIFPIIKTVKRIRSHVKMKINGISIPLNEKTPALKYGALCAVTLPLLGMADSFDESFSITYTSESSPTLDFSIECRFYVFLYAFLSFLFESIKRRIKRNVGKQGKRNNKIIPRGN